jgi:hypothetical protein
MFGKIEINLNPEFIGDCNRILDFIHIGPVRFNLNGCSSQYV